MFRQLRHKSNSGSDRRETPPPRHIPESISDSAQVPLWAARLPLQTALTVSAPGDRYEQEAARVAAQVMRQPALRVQAAAASTVPVTEAPQIVHDVIRSPGHPLDGGVRHFMESRFGTDFGHVRVHTGDTAARSATSVNADAYTVGHNIVFNARQYTPSTGSGKALIAHELAHTIQQQETSDALHRLIRTPYPWRGVITPARGANIRSSPRMEGDANKLGALAQGHPVKVLSNTGDWLRVETQYAGRTITGYVYHTLIDDAASAEMESSVGTTMVWRPSGPGSGTDFETWASAPSETSFPAVTATTIMNCWEAVLLAAYRAGSIDWNWIHNLYTSVPTSDWVDHMSRGARTVYAIPGPNATMPQRGDMVFFDGLAHIALATGNGSEVYTFWPPPNTPFTAGGTTDKVKVFTIEDLVAWWAANLPPAPTVEFGAPNW